MAKKKEPSTARTPIGAASVKGLGEDPAQDPIRDPAPYDAFAEQVAKAALWSDAAKAQLPKKPT